jgi:hypothetical protein
MWMKQRVVLLEWTKEEKREMKEACQGKGEETEAVEGRSQDETELHCLWISVAMASMDWEEEEVRGDTAELWSGNCARAFMRYSAGFMSAAGGEKPISWKEDWQEAMGPE